MARMGTRIAAVAGAALMLTATGCSALGAGGGDAGLSADELQQQVEELAEAQSATEIIGLRIALTGNAQSGATLVTPDGITSKSLDTGEDLVTGTIDPAPFGTTPVAEYPYAEALEVAQSEDASCPEGKNPLVADAHLLPGGGNAVSIECAKGGSGGVWLDGERLPELDDAFAPESIERLMSEAEAAIGDQFVELTFSGPGGPLGEQGAGARLTGAERDFFGKTCYPLLVRALAPDSNSYGNPICETAPQRTEPFAISDFPASDVTGAIEFGMQELGIPSTAEIADVHVFVEDGERSVQILGTEQNIMGTIRLDD